MKYMNFRRTVALLMALCLCVLPTLSQADTYLPDGDVTHVDFTLGASLHAANFPESKAHLSDWETFLSKLDLKGAMDTLAMLTPNSRVYLNGAIRLNGKDQIPFVYDGYHSYRYLISPALNNEILFFQMHNFLEFMLKPYYYMDLPTEYLALLMYPEAAYHIGESYYNPVVDMLSAAKEAAQESAAADLQTATDAALADAQASLEATLTKLQARLDTLDKAMQSGDEAALQAALKTETANCSAEASPADTVDTTGATVKAALEADIASTQAAQASLAEAAQAGDSAQTLAAIQAALPTLNTDALTAAAAAATGTGTYTVPYEDLYELSETLDLIMNDDPELERGYFFVTCLLTQLYASDMMVDMLGRLEDVLDYLDPEQNGMTVAQTADGLTCTLGQTQVFSKSTQDGVTTISFNLPTADGFELTFLYRWDPIGSGAKLTAVAAINMDGKPSVALSVQGDGLPREGDVSGKGSLTVTASGTSFETAPAPFTLAFDWVRDAVQMPYTLDLTLDWIHPQTQKSAVSLHFNGTFTQEDKSVFVEGVYPQNDFFNLNESFLNEYKARMLKPLMLKLAPILLETPAGVINDLYQFAQQNDILVSIVE